MIMAIDISNKLAEYLNVSILNLVECCLCLNDVFYFSSIHIEAPRTKLFIFLVVY